MPKMRGGYQPSWQVDGPDRLVRMLCPGVAGSPLQALRPPGLLHLAGPAGILLLIGMSASFQMKTAISPGRSRITRKARNSRAGNIPTEPF